MAYKTDYDKWYESIRLVSRDLLKLRQDAHCAVAPAKAGVKTRTEEAHAC